MTVIEAQGISKVFRDASKKETIALANVDLTVADREFLVLLGPSGCGKTTLLRILAGLERPTSGRIRSHGKSGSIAQNKAPIGFVFQKPTLMPWRTALQNIELPLELAGWSKSRRLARAEELLELVGLGGAGGKLPEQLSGGMQQRVALARALSDDPGILLMDEPFGALDAQTRDDMNVELQRIWLETSKTVVFVTHSVKEAVFLADRVVMMNANPGRINSITQIMIPRPRRTESLDDQEYRELSHKLRSELTTMRDKA